MSAGAIRLTCADCAQVMPLGTGAVQPERFGLELLLGKRGSWPDRAEADGGPHRPPIPGVPGRRAAVFADTGVFPPQHLVVLRRAVWEVDRSLAPALTAAFERCQTYYCDQTRSFPYASPWLEAELEQTAAAMGDDPYAHGLERNRATLKIFCDMGHRLGLTEKHVTVDDYFGQFIAS